MGSGRIPLRGCTYAFGVEILASWAPGSPSEEQRPRPSPTPCKRETFLHPKMLDFSPISWEEPAGQDA